METCKTCKFRDVRPSRQEGNMCIFLSQPRHVTKMEAYPMCEHDGPAVHYYIDDDFGCVHHTTFSKLENTKV